MKIKVEWRRETQGVSEVEVNVDEVADWLNDSGDPKAPITPESVTAQDCYDFLDSGDDEEWIQQIDHDRDMKPFPWGDDYELEGLVRE